MGAKKVLKRRLLQAVTVRCVVPLTHSSSLKNKRVSSRFVKFDVYIYKCKQVLVCVVVVEVSDFFLSWNGSFLLERNHHLGNQELQHHHRQCLCVMCVCCGSIT